MGQKEMCMVDIEQQAKAQLMMIEKIYSLKLTNRDEIAQLIARKVDNDRQVLTICTSLNSWVLLNRKSGNVVIPREIILKLLERIEWQNKNA